MPEKDGKNMKFKSLLFIGCVILTMTACGQTSGHNSNTPQLGTSSVATQSTNSDVSSDTASSGSSEAASENGTDINSSSETESASSDTTDATSEDGSSSTHKSKKSAWKKSSLLNPQEISFEDKQFTNYLQQSYPDGETVTVFGFNAPDGYDSKQSLGFGSFGDPTDPSNYAAAPTEDIGYLYAFILGDYAEEIQEYLKTDTWPASSKLGPDADYPMFLGGDTVTHIEKKETLDTIYGSCDILFMELETDLAEDDIFGISNPIYAEAAYFSMYIYTSPQTRTLYDIAIFYMYPPYDDSINTYQGQLAALLPDMLTPAAS